MSTDAVTYNEVCVIKNEFREKNKDTRAEKFFTVPLAVNRGALGLENHVIGKKFRLFKQVAKLYLIASHTRFTHNLVP